MNTTRFLSSMVVALLLMTACSNDDVTTEQPVTDLHEPAPSGIAFTATVNGSSATTRALT